MRNSTIGERLLAVREFRVLTQSQLAEKTGIIQTSISHFESGRRDPSLNSLCKLADALNVSTDYLLGRSYLLRPARLESSGLDMRVELLSEENLELLGDIARVLMGRQ